MIEVYVGLTLLGLGYMLNQQNPNSIFSRTQPNTTKQIHLNELNNFTSPYSGNHLRTSQAIETRKAAQHFNKINNPVPTAGKQRMVIPKDKDAMVRSPLTGMSIPQKDFMHNNMKPYGRVKAMGNEKNLDPRMEAFTGSYTYYQPKQEIEPLFKPQKDVGNVYGSAANTQYYMDRVEKPKVQNNTLPFQQVKVGPALNRGYGCKPDGGYQQLDARNYAMPKSVDELRVGSNPKTTFEGRVVDGQKGTRPGMIGAVAKNRVETYYQNTPERYFKTTGAFLKPTQQVLPIDKATNRQETSTSYSGVAYINKAGAERGQYREPMKNQLEAVNVGTAVMTGKTNGRDDYGKGSIQVYSNERDITTTRTYQGNVTTIVKALIAPLQDLVKVTKKEQTVENPREYGQFQSTAPSKPPVMDPNNVLPTTLKDTLLTSSQALNLKGHTMTTVIDPNAVARTTIKETLLNSSENLNVKGPQKLTVYDPNNILPTTIKETLLHDSENLNLRGPSKGIAYDPNNIARTTAKETMLHDAPHVNIKGERSMGVVYDPENKAKVTGRQTIDPLSTNLNLASKVRAMPAHDPNDTARTTLKQTMIESQRDFGNVDRSDLRQGAYELEEFDVPDTQRNQLTGEYLGNPNRPKTDGYQVVDATPRDTQRQVLADKEYFGTAQTQGAQAPRSYEDIYNATINSLKEETLVGREPTQTSVKVVAGGDKMGDYTVKRQELMIDLDEVGPGADRITNMPIDSRQLGNVTRNPQKYDDIGEDMIDVDILKPFKDNPYTQPLDSYS